MAQAQLQELEKSKLENERQSADVPRSTDSIQEPFINLTYPEVVRYGVGELCRRIHFNT